MNIKTLENFKKEFTLLLERYSNGEYSSMGYFIDFKLPILLGQTLNSLLEREAFNVVGGEFINNVNKEMTYWGFIEHVLPLINKITKNTEPDWNVCITDFKEGFDVEPMDEFFTKILPNIPQKNKTVYNKSFNVTRNSDTFSVSVRDEKTVTKVNYEYEGDCIFSITIPTPEFETTENLKKLLEEANLLNKKDVYMSSGHLAKINLINHCLSLVCSESDY